MLYQNRPFLGHPLRRQSLPKLWFGCFRRLLEPPLLKDLVLECTAICKIDKADILVDFTFLELDDNRR